MVEMKHEELTRRVIGCAIEVHRELGPGLLESSYELCLAHELTGAGITFKRQEPVPTLFKGFQLDCSYRADFLIESVLLLELKSIEQLKQIHQAQLLTYMKHAQITVGLLINFNVTVLKNGLKRYVL